MPDNRKALANLQPGSPLFLDVPGLAVRLNSLLVGMCPKKFILVTVPRQPEATPQTIYPLLYQGNTVTCYAMLPGSAAAFKSHIIRFIMSPFPLIFLSFPPELQLVNVRKHARVRCLFDGVLRLGQTELRGMITDLSHGGCSFTFPLNGQPTGIKSETPVELECGQLGAVGKQTLNASVRSTSGKEKIGRLGLRFESVPPELGASLERFILDALKLELA